jgi:hypothetical protein
MHSCITDWQIVNVMSRPGSMNCAPDGMCLNSATTAICKESSLRFRPSCCLTSSVVAVGIGIVEQSCARHEVSVWTAYMCYAVVRCMCSSIRLVVGKRELS